MRLSSNDLRPRVEVMDGPFSTTDKLLIVLLVLLIVSLLAIAALFFLKRRRNHSKQAGLPLHYNELSSPQKSKHRRSPGSLIIPANGHSITFPKAFDYYEKQHTPKAGSRPPSYPLPEIRIHFSDDSDPASKPLNARVVVVKMDENSAGLEPVEEFLPSYREDASEKFHSLDLERIGGLEEKHYSPC